ncbi:MAG: hypothetical protein CL840_11670 [Crocinitomicaceae bacterium]|nr:hypothetical protein [Crocinitomicaceae bacterium]|tara:strand:+ start:1525 stop:2340 length:816 start_codon:yes stop_codon:yes gene_type:complete
MKISITIGFAFTFLLLSCNFIGEDEQVDTDVILADSVSDRFTHELGTVRKNIEQSATMYNRLFKLNCPYNPELPLPDQRAYDLTSQKAIGFGAYAASFVYCASYQQTQQATKYLDFIIHLSEELGIAGSFDEDDLVLLLSNDTSVDKSATLTRVYLKATEQLYTQERAILVSYMVAGGWVEGMKMSYETCGDYLDKDGIRLGIYDQTFSYYNCVRILETFSEDEEVATLGVRMKELQPLIDKVVKTRGDIDEELFSQVKSAIAILREEIHN